MELEQLIETKCLGTPCPLFGSVRIVISKQRFGSVWSSMLSPVMWPQRVLASFVSKPVPLGMPSGCTSSGITDLSRTCLLTPTIKTEHVQDMTTLRLRFRSAWFLLGLVLVTAVASARTLLETNMGFLYILRLVISEWPLLSCQFCHKACPTREALRKHMSRNHNF